MHRVKTAMGRLFFDLLALSISFVAVGQCYNLDIRQDAAAFFKVEVADSKERPIYAGYQMVVEVNNSSFRYVETN